MKNRDQWQPTKYVKTKQGLRASRDLRRVGMGSRFVVDVVAAHYERALRDHACGDLLDLGCGFVPLYGTYCDLVQDVICVDWENTLHPSPYLDFTVDLNSRIPLEDSSFDTIVLTDVLEHIAEPAALINEIGRLLRPGGKLIAGVPFLYGLHEVPFDFYRYTEHALRRFCEGSGLEVLCLEPYGGLPEILIDLTSKGIQGLPRGFASICRPIHSVATRLFWSINLSRRLSQRTAVAFPLGYLLVARVTQPLENPD